MDQAAQAIQQLVELTLRISTLVSLVVSGIVGAATFFVTRWYENKLALGREKKIEDLSAQHSKELEQLRSDLNAQAKKMQVFLDTTSHVRRAQFEVEFRAYQAIWPKIFWLKEAALVLRPMMEPVDLNKAPEEWRNDKFKTFRDAYNAALFEVENNSPFYAPDIYAALKGLLNAARNEQLAFEYLPEPTMTTPEEYEKTRGDIAVAFARAGDAIRARLAKITVID